MIQLRDKIVPVINLLLQKKERWRNERRLLKPRASQVDF